MIGAISALTFLFLIGVANAVDYSLCYGQTQGAHVPNTANCASYYVCNHGYPELFECRGNLLYDYERKVCNWPTEVSCGQVLNPQPPQQPPQHPPQEPQQPLQPIAPVEPPIVPDLPPIEIENPNEHLTGQEYYPGVIIQDEYPNLYACKQGGFYFVPHLYECEKYFICENYKIHQHQCGPGIHWDYIFAQCDLASRSHCFGAPAPQPPPVNDEYDDVEESVELTTSAAESITDVVSACPGDQAFYPYDDDIHKYYICIGGIPILTSCPDGMNWDAENSQCADEDSSVFHSR